MPRARRGDGRMTSMGKLTKKAKDGATRIQDGRIERRKEVSAGVRASTRRQTPAMPYQSPESVSKLLRRVVEEKKNTKAEASFRQVLSKCKKRPAKLTTKKRKLIPVPAQKAIKMNKVLKIPKTVKEKVAPSAVVKKSGKRKRNSEASANGTKRLKNSDDVVSKGVKTKPEKKKRRSKFALTPRPEVTCYDKDPTFEMNVKIPSVSTVADSRLLLRSAILGDNKQLKSLLKFPEKISSTGIGRNLTCPDQDVYYYILKTQNLEALDILVTFQQSNTEALAPFPEVLVVRESTGHGSRYMFGHALRQVTVGRGGKEGNAALLKDTTHYGWNIKRDANSGDILTKALELGLSFDLLKKLDEFVTRFITGALENIKIAVRHGHRELAGQLVSEAIRRDGFGFNNLHAVVLNSLNPPAQSSFKSVSVVKKSTYSPRFTPLHCAAINPNPQVIQALIASNPETMILDGDQWSLLHYAAVGEVTDKEKCPMKYLLTSTGLSTLAVTKDGGSTPLHLACRVGRIANVELLVEYELNRIANSREPLDPKDTDEEPDEPKVRVSKKNKGKTFMQILNKQGMTPLHVAAQEGHLSIIKILLQVPDVDVNKGTPAQFDKMTPFMIACAVGHLEIVKYFVEKREELGIKLEQGDRRGRTGLIHAVMNGNAHVVSYLLREGVNHLTSDSSGNTCVHYAAAYGWYFCLQLLLEAQCPANVGNLWKMTPMAIAFMKGHIGLVQIFLQHPETDVNSPIDDSTGTTLLLQACSARASKTFLDRIKFLVTEGKADCTVTDFGKNNCLHRIVSGIANRKDNHDYLKKEAVWAHRAIEFLVSSGCDMHAENEEQITPFHSAVTSGCFHVLREKLLPLTPDGKPLNPISKDGSTILHVLNCHASEPEAELFLKEMQRKIKGQLEAFQAMATTYNKAGFTPLLGFLETFKKTSLTNEKLPRNTAYLSYLLNVLDSNVNAIVKKDCDKRSVLHIASECHHAKEYLVQILEKKSYLEVTDNNGRTPLVAAICNDNLEAATVLINAGASVQVKCGGSGDDVSKQPLLLYLFQRLACRCFSLVPLLIQKGADPLIVDPKTQKTLLHFMASSPSIQSCLDYCRLLLESGVKPDAIDEFGQTALHVVVSRRTGETDCTYDLEDLLVDTCPQALAIADKDERVPLHYAFSSDFHFKSTLLMDPIELVSFLVRSMKMNGMRSAIYKTDSWGRIPLHYAACRGSTISCSLLYAESPQLIDLKDNDGNTPLGLSVFYQHEGSSLQFQQMNADFLTVINKDMKAGKDETGLSTKDGSGSEEKIWELEYKVKGRIEEAKERKDGAICTILEQVVRNDWQGVLYLMLEKLENNGTSGVSPGILAAIRTLRLVLAKKLLKRVKNNADLQLDPKEGTVLHVLARFLNRSASAHVVPEVVKDLVRRNIDITALDEFDSSALIYACMSENSQLISLLWNEGLEREYTRFKDIVTRQDAYGRTVFSALFWKLEASYPSWSFSSWAEKFWDFGVNANLTCEYPICLTEFPGERYLRLAHLRSDGPGDQTVQRWTPLINGVIVGNYDIVKWLLEQKKFVDVNATDSKGRTAIMHAIKLNDIKMVKLLLNPKGYNPSEDNVPWKQMPFYVTNKKLDLNLEDFEGRGILEYLINPSSRSDFNYSNSGAIIRVLKMHKSFPLSSLITASLESAKNSGNTPLVQALQNALGIPKAKQAKVTDVFNINQDFKKVELLEGLRKIVDYANDAETMIEKMLKDREEKLAADKKKSLPPVDTLIGIGYDEYEVVVGENGVPMDCVLTKVDLNYGMFGLYNFYKMQLVKQRKGKEMIELFTRWGRVGDEGQYQKTPYATLEEAIKSFESIFKAKSGNDWQVMKNEQEGIQPGFVPAPKKYRLVHNSLRGHHETDGVEIDFESLRANTKKTETALPLSMFELLKEICLDCHSKGLKAIYGKCGVNQLPFGLLDSKAVRRGEEILKEIHQLLTNKEKLPSNGEAGTKEEEQTIMESLVEKSGEFFGTIPLYGYQSERLEPIFDVNALRKQENVLANIIHLEIATKLLLAAQLQCGLSSAGIPPLDYIYSSLGINMEALDPAEDEGQIILAYILNSSTNTSRWKVKNIFRVERDEERGQPHGVNVGNRWLLWHGTRDVNLLSILHRGLQPVPLGAQLSGHLFGKGIYFADMFAKSEHYCHGSGNNRYMLLCDVALGNVHPVDLHTTMEDKNGLPLGYHSILTTDTRYEPDPGTTISWKGRTIPLGKRTTRILPENKYYGLDYNEYVVFDHAQVRVKYLVQFQG